MKHILIIAMALVLISGTPVHAKHGEDMPPPAQNEILVKVFGLVCDFCARAVEKVFMKQDAVESINVDLDHMEVRVALKPESDLEDGLITELINDSGYTIVEIIRHEDQEL